VKYSDGHVVDLAPAEANAAFTQGSVDAWAIWDRYYALAQAVALADRVVVLADGRVTQESPVPLPRPRQRGSATFAALTGQILDRVILGGGRALPMEVEVIRSTA
jgi:hypothetical protein